MLLARSQDRYQEGFSCQEYTSEPRRSRSLVCRGIAVRASLAAGDRLAAARAGLAAAGQLAPDPDDRIVELGDDALLERDDRVVGDLDRFWADVGAALRDVAEAQAGLPLEELQPIVRVERVHLQRGQPHEEARPGEGRLVVLVITDDVADVLAQEALDALVEL